MHAMVIVLISALGEYHIHIHDLRLATKWLLTRCSGLCPPRRRDHEPPRSPDHGGPRQSRPYEVRLGLQRPSRLCFPVHFGSSGLPDQVLYSEYNGNVRLSAVLVAVIAFSWPAFLPFVELGIEGSERA